MANWKFKKDADIYSEEIWYDLTDGGFLKPDEILESKTKQQKDSIKQLLDAIKLVYDFQESLLDEIDKRNCADEDGVS